MVLKWICHQKVDRCFKIKGKTMPICSRCFGVYLFIFIGFVFSIVFKIATNLTKIKILGLIMLFAFPLFIDGITQSIKLRESTNLLRFITGSLAGLSLGIGLHWLIIYNNF